MWTPSRDGTLFLPYEPCDGNNGAPTLAAGTCERERLTTVPTILYVDDSPKALRLLSSVFQMCRYVVLTADDPRKALAMAETIEFDLAVFDYQLPHMSGVALARHIRRLRPEVPLLLFSAMVTLPEDELGAVDEVVAKGESLDLLLNKVRRLLKLRGKSPSP